MGRVTKLERVYDEIDKEYNSATPEKMEEAIKDLKEKREKKKSILEKMKNAPEDKKEPFEKEIKDLDKKITNMEGYSKNKVQIEKVRKYQELLLGKLAKEVYNKSMANAKIERKTPELKEVLNKLKDEKYTMSLDGDQYNALLQKREDLKKELKENKVASDMASKRITELMSKIGKCDLAWKTLFVNKDWDEIQRRALSDKKRLTRKTDAKNPPLNPAKTGKEVNKGSLLNEPEKQKNNDEKVEEEKQLPAKVSKWSKFKNWFRNIPNKFKETFGIKKKENEEKAETKDEGGEKSSTNNSRDEFLEGLRQYADEEYRKQVKEEKEKTYIEVHKQKDSEER